MSKDEVAIINDESSLPIMQLKPIQQRFIHLYLTGQYTMTKLSELLDVHINTIAIWMHNPLVKEIIAEMQKEQHEQVAIQLKSMQNKAISAINALLDSPIDAVKLQAAKEVLDRGGHKAKQEIKKDITITTFEQKLSELMDSAIDVNYIDVEDDE